MILNYKPEKIEKLSCDFLIATGVKLAVYDVNFKLLNYKEQNDIRYCAMIQSKEAGKQACIRSDAALLEQCKETGRAAMHICHAGLIDLALPILYEKKIIAYLMLGQIKTKEDFSSSRVKKLFADGELCELEESFRELPLFGQDRIDSILNIAVMVVKYILFENVLVPKYASALDRAVSFINDNIGQDLSITTISKATLIPKSSLYKLFHLHLNCTVSEYVNSKRIKRASELLVNSEMPITEISEKLGFSTQQYFSKTFKRITGVSPMQFRKNNT